MALCNFCPDFFGSSDVICVLRLKLEDAAERRQDRDPAKTVTLRVGFVLVLTAEGREVG